MGRPPVYNNPEELQDRIDAYFDWIQGDYNQIPAEDGLSEVKIYERDPEPATITGLCYFLGFESRQSFHDYGNKPEFSYTIKIARLRIEYAYEISMHSARNPVAHLFALKNLGWSDKQEIEHSGATTTNIINLGSGKNPDETTE